MRRLRNQGFEIGDEETPDEPQVENDEVAPQDDPWADLAPSPDSPSEQDDSNPFEADPWDAAGEKPDWDPAPADDSPWDPALADDSPWDPALTAETEAEDPDDFWGAPDHDEAEEAVSVGRGAPGAT